MSSKKFLKVVFALILTFPVLATIFISYFYDKENIPYRFSNSISYDAKISFLKRNKEKLINADTIVIGSSMGLNNIDSEYLRNNKLINILNVSSWGLQVGEVKQLLSILDLTNVKQVIYSTQYFDFKKNLIKDINEGEVKKFIYGDFSFYPYINNLKYFALNLLDNLNYNNIYKDKNKYTYLDFDRNGDINFVFDNKTYINKNRWSDISTDRNIDLTTFNTLIKMNEYLKLKDIKLIVITTPYRKEILENSNIKNDFDIYTKKLIHLSKKYNFVYLNAHYALNLDDSHFVDQSHLNLEGAKKVSLYVSDNFEE